MITSTLFSYQKAIFMRLKSKSNTQTSSQFWLKNLDDNKKNYYSYQLKSSKDQQVVTKGIKADVQPTEVAHVLRENGFEVKSVTNIIKRNLRPQPLNKVELVPASPELTSPQSLCWGAA